MIPLDTQVPDGPLNTFTVYEDRIATAETFGGVIMMRDPRDVKYHLELFAFFERYAVFGDELRKLWTICGTLPPRFFVNDRIPLPE